MNSMCLLKRMKFWLKRLAETPKSGQQQPPKLRQETVRLLRMWTKEHFLRQMRHWTRQLVALVAGRQSHKSRCSISSISELSKKSEISTPLHCPLKKQRNSCSNSANVLCEAEQSSLNFNNLSGREGGPKS